MHVLVTGASGFLGYAVARKLALAGHQVTSLARHLPAAPRRLVTGHTILGDLREPESLPAAVEGVQAVCHFAGLSYARGTHDAAGEYDQINCEGTRAVLSAIAREGRRTGSKMRIVFASTTQVYGTPRAAPIPEDYPARPVNPYAMSKLAAERLISEQAEAGLIGAITLRITNVAGAVAGHGDPNVARIIPRIMKVASGHAPYLEINGDGEARRDYLHVLDFASACALALSACRQGEHRIYNVGSGVGTSVLEMVSLAESITGNAIPIIFRVAQLEPRTLIADIERIRKELAWRPELSTPTRILGDAWTAQISHSDAGPGNISS